MPPPDRDEVKRRLVTILTTQFGVNADLATISDDTSILNDLMFDSLQILDLVVAVELEFGISFSGDDLTLDIFDKLGRVVDFVNRKSRAATHGNEMIGRREL